MFLYYGWFLCTHQWNNQENRFIYFLSKSEKGENISSSSTGREKLIDLSNNLQDELLRGITNLSVIHYHSNEYYKPYTLEAQRELENRKRKEHRTENNEAKSSVLVDQGAQNDKNQMTIEGMNALYAETFRKERKLFRLCETERAEIVLAGNKI